MFKRKKDIFKRLNNIKDISSQDIEYILKYGINDDELSILEKTKYPEELARLFTNKKFRKYLSKNLQSKIIHLVDSSESQEYAHNATSTALYDSIIESVHDIISEREYYEIINIFHKSNNYTRVCELLYLSSPLFLKNSYSLSILRIINDSKEDYQFDYALSFVKDNISGLDKRALSMVKSISKAVGVEQAKYGYSFSHYLLNNYNIPLKVLDKITYSSNPTFSNYLEKLAENEEIIRKDLLFKVIDILERAKEDYQIEYGYSLAIDEDFLNIIKVSSESEYFKILDIIINSKSREKAYNIYDTVSNPDVIERELGCDIARIIDDTEHDYQAILVNDASYYPDILKDKEVLDVLKIVSSAKCEVKGEYDFDNLFDALFNPLFRNDPKKLEILKTICNASNEFQLNDAIYAYLYINSDSFNYDSLDMVRWFANSKSPYHSKVAMNILNSNVVLSGIDVNELLNRVNHTDNVHHLSFIKGAVNNYEDFFKNENALLLIDNLFKVNDIDSIVMLDNAYYNKDFIEHEKVVQITSLLSKIDNREIFYNTLKVATNKDVLDSDCPLRLVKMASHGVSSKNVIGLTKIINAYKAPKYTPRSIHVKKLVK